MYFVPYYLVFTFLWLQIVAVPGCIPKGLMQGFLVDFYDGEGQGLEPEDYSLFLAKMEHDKPDEQRTGIVYPKLQAYNVKPGDKQSIHGRMTNVDDFGLRLTGYFFC